MGGGFVNFSGRSCAVGSVRRRGRRAGASMDPRLLPPFPVGEGGSMDVVVTGTSGLIGTALRWALDRAGHRFVPMTRATGADGIHWDPDAGAIDAGALEGVGAGVHLAGEGIGNQRWNGGQRASIGGSVLRGTPPLAEPRSKPAKPPKALLSGSAVGFYGDRGDEVL